MGTPCKENNFTIAGGAQIVLRPEQVADLGISTAVTFGAMSILPTASRVASTVVATVSVPGLI